MYYAKKELPQVETRWSNTLNFILPIIIVGLSPNVSPEDVKESMMPPMEGPIRGVAQNISDRTGIEFPFLNELPIIAKHIEQAIIQNGGEVEKVVVLRSDDENLEYSPEILEFYSKFTNSYGEGLDLHGNKYVIAIQVHTSENTESDFTRILKQIEIEFPPEEGFKYSTSFNDTAGTINIDTYYVVDWRRIQLEAWRRSNPIVEPKNRK